MAQNALACARLTMLASGRYALVGPTGDVVFLTGTQVRALQTHPPELQALGTELLAELYAKHFLRDSAGPGMARLFDARICARNETLNSGVSLHIIVPTLQCEHTCRYCQVSRAAVGDGFSMTRAQVELAADAVFQSSAPMLTVEFQGGDPLLRFDLVRLAIERISQRSIQDGRKVQFVVASTLHQLNEEMCAFFRAYSVSLSTSLDGPAHLHNRNRPTPARDSYERTVAGIELARRLISRDCVSALMTVTRESLSCPQEIVDEYVRLGFDEIFIRPMALYGFAMKNAQVLGYTFEAFDAFYAQCLERVFWWNANGTPIREAAASVWMNKLLSPFDSGYVDLQRVSGAGRSVLVYNYDGWVYPSDEARMLAETGQSGLRLGRIGAPIQDCLSSPVNRSLQESSDGGVHPQCADCAFNAFCGPDPVEELATGDTYTVASSWHCRRSKSMFEWVLNRLDLAREESDDGFLDLAHAWAHRTHPDSWEGISSKAYSNASAGLARAPRPMKVISIVEDNNRRSH